MTSKHRAMGMWITASFIRVAVTVCVLSVASTQSSTSSVTEYPSEVHDLVQQRLAKGQPGSWSSWSQWSPCTRTCGGGITTQTRDCRSKPMGRHRRRSHSIVPQHHCVGLYKRIHICNTKECPGTTDFRQEQCSRYNGQQFLGRAYDWEPFMEAPNQCALNCRARGFRFYATLNATVEDGTPCRGYIIGHDTDRWICVTGQCKHVGCDGVVGSDQRYDTCGVCGGDNSTCRVISGLFTRPQLPVGYNLITQIPQAACNLSIVELKQSRNYLALRKNDGTFILNGNWAINWSGEFDALGTKFSYHREDDNTAESISSQGPLAEPLDLMVIYQQPNPGIKYQYQLPVITSSPSTESTSVYKAKKSPMAPLLRQADSPSPPEEKEHKDKVNAETRHNSKLFPYGNSVFGSELQGYSGDEAPKPKPKGKKKKFAWKITGFSECSKSCGGGVQTAAVVCVREHNQLTVPDRRCASLEKPTPQVMRCNLKPCIAEWVGGDWGECSVSCGDGVQSREILCRQKITPTLTMTVAEGACLTPPSPLLQRARPCQRPPCLGLRSLGTEQWTVGAWSQCSAKCGTGVQTRSVLCLSGNCNVNERPATETACSMPPCQNHRHTHSWLYTDWTQECSESCGTGVQRRRVLCSAGLKMDTLCDASARPDHQRACSSDKHCGPVWFSGPWDQCTASCGWGRQSRSVVCLSKTQGQLSVAADDKCSAVDKPATEQQCKLQSCGPEWYMGDWSQCSRSCDTGAQRRDVRCLDDSQQVTTGCSESSKPPTRRSCNTHKCPTAEEGEKKEASSGGSVQSNDSLRDQPQLQAPANTDIGGECKDRFRNCHLVVQARLCKYKYYRTSCCLACHNKL